MVVGNKRVVRGDTPCQSFSALFFCKILNNHLKIDYLFSSMSIMNTYKQRTLAETSVPKYHTRGAKRPSFYLYIYYHIHFNFIH